MCGTRSVGIEMHNMKVTIYLCVEIGTAGADKATTPEHGVRPSIFVVKS